MKGLNSILGDSVKQAGGTRRAEEQGCLELWTAVVGENVAAATRAERLRDGILFVVATSSVWAYELSFFKADIIQKINEKLGRTLIRDIRFKVGPLVQPAPPNSAEQKPEVVPLPRRAPETGGEESLPEPARAQVEHALSSIADDRIRERTRTVLVREALRKERRQKSGWKECPRCGTLHPENHRLCPLCRLHIRT